MKGRKPKPVARHISEGDPSKFGMGRLHDRLERQIQPTQGLPRCPSHLRGRARTAWNTWSRELRAVNLDAHCDAQMLEGACVNYARAVEADILLAKVGAILADPIVDKNGEPIRDDDGIALVRLRPHPAIAISNAAWRQVRGFCSEFGLSPVSRTRLTIEKPDTSTQDLMELLTRPRDRGVQSPRVQ